MKLGCKSMNLKYCITYAASKRAEVAPEVSVRVSLLENVSNLKFHIEATAESRTIRGEEQPKTQTEELRDCH